MKVPRLAEPARSTAVTAVLVVALVGCTNQVVCPAVGYSTTLEVTLDPSWPDRSELQISVSCVGDDARYCDSSHTSGDGRWTGTATFWTDEVDVVVRDGSAVLATVRTATNVELESEPHGRGCGGPARGIVTVPSAGA